ncbi:hypothetical protein KSP40_PGU017238 [Platanthera guangdongensis]|uniref:Uncharacterized protein n=1 Tax=Platanthera guangdongensis TaxID=2320717 RepID=A0ABR2M8P8_9ASPA
MVWSHPGISIEDLVDRIKGFVDILVLASGYQSSGLPAIWDVGSIKKALKWGIFFEDVLKSLRSYANYEESVKELDAALSHLTSDPNFPLGLTDMSSATLSNARRLVLEHFLHAHPIKDTHLAAFLRAVVEIDMDELSESHSDSSSAYIGRLDLQMESLDLAAKKLLPKNDAIVDELCQFSHWRSRCLSYLLDKRTIKLLSGAQLILEAPKEQWIRVFDGLKSSSDPCYENLLEIVEILLLGLISSKWNYMIQQLIALPCDFVSISKKFLDLHELVSRKFSFQGNSSALLSNKENDILEYLTSLLNFQPHKLWKLPSVLVAAALPLW